MKNIILILSLLLLLSACAVGFNDGYVRGSVYVPPPVIYYEPYNSYGYWYGPTFYYYGNPYPYFRPHFYYGHGNRGYRGR